MVTGTLPLMVFHDSRRGILEAIETINDRVYHMTQDAMGRLWLALENSAVYRYDGYEWVKFVSTNSGLDESC